MLTLLRGAECFSPDYLGHKNLLIGGGRILQLQDDEIAEHRDFDMAVYDLSGKWIVPGLVDSLVHITGGGGEGGFASRTPELQLSEAIEAGVTTMVGALGTDSVTRTLSNLIAKARELQLGGIFCRCHTGSYHLPPKTLTGSVESDIVFIPEIIGVGEVAISDHRTCQPTALQLASLAAEARVAGMISGKAGIVSIHTGDGDQCLEPINAATKVSDISLAQFYPTHMNRNKRLFESSYKHLNDGGWADFTTSTTPEILASGELKCSAALSTMLADGLDSNRITFSSDGNASLPLFDADGVLSGMQVGKLSSLWGEVRDAIRKENVDPAVALSVATRNPANILQLAGRGVLAENSIADLLVIDSDTLQIESVMTNGTWRMLKGELLQKGPFE